MDKYFGVYTIPTKYYLYSYPSKYFQIFVMCLFNTKKIKILNFYYHTFNIALGGILYQKLPQKLWRTIFLRHQTNWHLNAMSINCFRIETWLICSSPLTTFSLMKWCHMSILCFVLWWKPWFFIKLDNTLVITWINCVGCFTCIIWNYSSKFLNQITYFAPLVAPCIFPILKAIYGCILLAHVIRFEPRENK